MCTDEALKESCVCIHVAVVSFPLMRRFVLGLDGMRTSFYVALKMKSLCTDEALKSPSVHIHVTVGSFPLMRRFALGLDGMRMSFYVALKMNSLCVDEALREFTTDVTLSCRQCVHVHNLILGTLHYILHSTFYILHSPRTCSPSTNIKPPVVDLDE